MLASQETGSETATTVPVVRVRVVGAGIAGLLAARMLHDVGHEVVVHERKPVAGGRLATVDLGGGARADSGAQFFTVRTERFAALVDRLLAAGVVHEWCRGFGAEPDGYPRYAARGGMAALAAHLAHGLDVRLASPVDRLDDGNWVVAVPVPHAIELLRTSGTEPPDPLTVIEYEPTVALVARLDRPPAIPPPGGLQGPDATFSFVADNVAKGTSDAPSVTFHAPVAGLWAAARPYLGQARVLASWQGRWRYATPTPVLPEPCLEIRPGLVLAGDAFAGPRVEAAATSGWAAAARLLE
jgi:predicted NAD/FAD-dependent oxidoreductase